MIPDDDSVRRAMQRLEQGAADSPDLFDRVAAGARRRRRRQSITAVTAAAVVVALVALVPALDHGTSTTKVQPAGPLGPLLSPSPGVIPVPALGPSTSGSAATVLSPSAVASSASPVVSPSPPLSSAPPTPPLVTTGACAGLTVSASFDAGQDFVGFTLAPSPHLNTISVSSGSTVIFEPAGPAACVKLLLITPTAGPFPIVASTAGPGQPVAPTWIRTNGPGVDLVEVTLKSCDAAGSCSGSQVLADAIVSVDPPATSTSTASPVSKNLGACPTVLPLVPGPDAAAQAKAAAIKVVPTIYPPEPTKDFTVTAVYAASASGDNGYGTIAYGACGKTIGDRTWVVEVHFPHDPMNSASTGNGQLFVADFATGGWQVWYRYH